MSDEEYELFRSYVESHCAIALGDEKKYLLESRLVRLVARAGARSFAEFFRRVVESEDDVLRDQVIDAITTNETMWFRDSLPWRTLRDSVLPELVARGAGRDRKLRIWSAGCSTGQEPYSLAMLVDDFCRSNPGVAPDGFEILATDVSQSALWLAKSARYDTISMRRGMTDDWQPFRERYFLRRGGATELTDDIRGRVSFFRANLQDDFAALGPFDLVLLRYVAIYFAPTFRLGLLERIARSTRQHGYLLLGATESLPPPSAFRAERIGRCYFYRPGGPPR